MNLRFSLTGTARGRPQISSSDNPFSPDQKPPLTRTARRRQRQEPDRRRSSVMVYTVVSPFIVTRIGRMFLLEVTDLNYQGVEQNTIQLVVLFDTIAYALIVSIFGAFVYHILLSVIWSGIVPLLVWRLFAHFLRLSAVVSLGVVTMSVRSGSADI